MLGAHQLRAARDSVRNHLVRHAFFGVSSAVGEQSKWEWDAHRLLLGCCDMPMEAIIGRSSQQGSMSGGIACTAPGLVPTIARPAVAVVAAAATTAAVVLKRIYSETKQVSKPGSVIVVSESLTFGIVPAGMRECLYLVDKMSYGVVQYL